MAKRIMADRPTPKAWIDAIHPYVPGKAKSADGRELVKLSANENPLGCSPTVIDALAANGLKIGMFYDWELVNSGGSGWGPGLM